VHNEKTSPEERVTAIIGRQGKMPRPEDMRCRAKVGSGQCSKELTFIADENYWSKFCVEHSKKDAKARREGKPRVERA
jgi:hypothetical protein